MAVRKIGVSAALVLTASVLMMAGCAPSVTLKVQRTPALNTGGIQRLAVMPFKTERGGGYQSVAQHATTAAQAKIQSTNHFTLVSPTAVEPRRRAGEAFDDLADALFIGQIVRIDEETNSEQGQKTDKDGNKITYTYYVRDVEVEINYSIVKARDGAIIGPVTRKGRARDRNDSRRDLASDEALAKRVIDNLMSSLPRDIAPYTITVSRPLAKDPNKALKPQMESALAQVKSGNYVVARDAYIAIYDSHKSMAAAENASIILEALGETQAGADLMQRVFDETGNPRARDVLARLNKELSESAGVGDFKDKSARSPAERAAETAGDEVRKYLPEDSRVWIINNSAEESALANSVIDNVAAALLKNGVTVVDRQNTDLIQAEQAFQMSGHVNDDEIVSAGNLAGVNRIIFVSVIGSGAARRLQVRVLDVTRGTVLMQSDTGDKWSL
jgi:hypothetical protein